MISKSLMAAILLSSTLLGVDANARLFDFSPKELKKQSQALNDVYSGVKFNYLDQADRLLIINDFLKAVELEYALLPLKAERVGLDYKKLKEEAIAAEMNVMDITIAAADRKNDEAREKISFLQASSNMDFLDRMLALVAQFKDTHFSVYEKISRPFMYNGIRLFRIDGKVIVGSMEVKLLGMASKLSGTDFSSIKLGDEVVSIDGVPVEEKVKELKNYISGSSDEFVDSQAVRSLTLRNFKYEKKNYMRIEFKRAGSFKLPLFANSSAAVTPRLDMITYLNKYNIPSDATAIGITFDQTTRKWNDSDMAFSGYSTKSLAANLKGMNEYIGESGTAALRTGYYIAKGKSYGVMQIMTFSTETVKNGATTLDFLDAIRAFVLELKENELPLIIDLRVNNGGNGSYPAQVLSMIAEEKAEYATSTTAMRMTQYIRQVNEQELYQRVVGEDENEGVTIDILKNIIQSTLDDHKEYTPMYNYGVSITADPKVGGFKNKIVALLTADCISACDKTAFLLKSSKRATIIGSHSNGTGAGFTSTEELNTKWEDRLRVFSTTIPNYLFGVPGDLNTIVFGEDSATKMCSENKPTIADIQYSSTMVDLAKSNLGWLQKAAQVIDAK